MQLEQLIINAVKNVPGSFTASVEYDWIRQRTKYPFQYCILRLRSYWFGVILRMRQHNRFTLQSICLYMLRLMSNVTNYSMHERMCFCGFGFFSRHFKFVNNHKFTCIYISYISIGSLSCELDHFGQGLYSLFSCAYLTDRIGNICITNVCNECIRLMNCSD